MSTHADESDIDKTNEPVKQGSDDLVDIKNEQPQVYNAEIVSDPVELEVMVQHMVQHIVRRESYFAGPLPPPELLEQYNNVLPGCAELIVQQFVDQGNHRRELEKLVVGGDVIRAKWGLISGFLLGLVGLAGSFYVISVGYSVVGLAAIILALGTLVGSFIYATRKRNMERQLKENAVPEQQELPPSTDSS